MAEPAIRTDGLSKRYGTIDALKNLTLQVQTGEVMGYLGPNGAGKTTTIRLLLGLIRPSAGSSRIFSCDSWGDPVRAHRRLAYVAGEANLWPSLTGEETLHLLANLTHRVDLEPKVLFGHDPPGARIGDGARTRGGEHVESRIDQRAQPSAR